MANERIREIAKSRKIPLWEIASALNISDKTFSRQLRKELPEERQNKIMWIMDHYVAIGKNPEIKEAASARSVYLWQIAEKMKMSDSEFSRFLRKELSTEDKAVLLAIIDELAAGTKTNNSLDPNF